MDDPPQYSFSRFFFDPMEVGASGDRRLCHDSAVTWAAKRGAPGLKSVSL